MDYVLQEDVVKRSPDLLRLGLLLVTMTPEKACVHKVPKWLSLPHKIFQDVLAGYFISKRDKVIIKKLNLLKQESILVGCVLPACPYQMSTPVGVLK